MTPFNIYLWGIVDPLRAGILTINIVLFSAAAFSAFTGFVEEDESFVSRAKRFFIFGCIAIALRGVIPSSQTIAAIVILPRISESQAIQRDLPDLYNAAVKKLKAELGVQAEK